MKILLSQIGSMGDCLLVSALTKQIKEYDFPNSELTWLIGKPFSQLLLNNPYVDKIIEIDLAYDNTSILNARKQIRDIIDYYNKRNRYDLVLPMDFVEENNNLCFLWGTYKSSYLRLYKHLTHKLIRSVQDSIVFLSDYEVRNVDNFLKKNRLLDKSIYLIVFECSPKSSQSPITLEFASKISKFLVDKYSFLRIVLTSKEHIESSASIISGSALSFRENAELLNRCDLFIGSNSGISWLYNSTWSKRVPMIQIVKDQKYFEIPFLSVSMMMDYYLFKFQGSKGIMLKNYLELLSPDFNEIVACISLTIERSIYVAKAHFEKKTNFKRELNYLRFNSLMKAYHIF